MICQFKLKLAGGLLTQHVSLLTDILRALTWSWTQNWSLST